MNSRKVSIICLIIGILIICIAAGGLLLRKKNQIYTKISEELKNEIMSTAKGCKGIEPGLNSERASVGWVNQTEQTKLMDKVLYTIKVKGESNNGRPTSFIIARYYNKMKLYIIYDKPDAYKNIIIEMKNHYYVATADEDAVNQVVKYMKDNLIINFHLPE